MNAFASRKWWWLGASVALLGSLAVLPGLTAAGAARLALGVAALGGFAAWAVRGRRHARFELPPRLQVVQRAALTQRSGVALLDVDGQAFVAVYGDGFARLQRVTRPKTPEAKQRALVTDEHAAWVPAGRSRGLS